jgi:hypothetical protein
MTKMVATKEQARGALPNGTRVRKVGTRAGDGHANGALGTIEGSLGPLDKDAPHGPIYAYCVKWDDTPNIPCWVSSPRVEPVGPIPN